MYHVQSDTCMFDVQSPKTIMNDCISNATICLNIDHMGFETVNRDSNQTRTVLSTSWGASVVPVQ